jgi:rhamnosyltransferase
MIFSVIVLYKPDLGVLKRISNLSKSSDYVYVVLNQINLFGELKLDITNGELIVIGKNIGLAKAINIGLKKCFESLECDYIAIFDQDSELCNSNSLREIVELMKCDKTDNLALIGHSTIDIKNKELKHRKNDSNIEVEDNLTSGSVISVSVLKKIGLMDEHLFIDYIDFEWCLRARYFGYKILSSKNHYLNHNLGDSFVNLFGLKKPVHLSPIREFYIIRNSLILLNRSYIPFSWKIRHFWKLNYRIFGYMVFSKNKIATVVSIYNAFFDFFKNKKMYKNYTFES